MLPLALCAIADDEHAAGVLAAGRRLAGTGAFRVVFTHVAEATPQAVASSARSAAAACEALR